MQCIYVIIICYLILNRRHCQNYDRHKTLVKIRLSKIFVGCHEQFKSFYIQIIVKADTFHQQVNTKTSMRKIIK